jgi:hypothetical protein
VKGGLFCVFHKSFTPPLIVAAIIYGAANVGDHDIAPTFHAKYGHQY